MELDDRIEKEEKRLKGLFKDLTQDKKKIAEKLFQNAAFMAITLEDLQQWLNDNGTVSKYQNGENQWGYKKSPEVELYNTMIKNYSTIIKQLTDLLPKGVDKLKEVDDGFDSFVNVRDG